MGVVVIEPVAYRCKQLVPMRRGCCSSLSANVDCYRFSGRLITRRFWRRVEQTGDYTCGISGQCLYPVIHWFSVTKLPCPEVSRLRGCCCSKIGEEQSAEDSEDGPPELLVSVDHVS